MKKLLLIPLLLLAFAGYAQLPVIRAPDGVTVEDYRAYFLKNFRLPVFSDTASANVAKGLDSVGTMISIRGTDTVYIRKYSLGAVKMWSLLTGTGGGGSGDTVFLYQIGTGAGQIETLYAVDGNLRKSRWITGYGTIPRLAADSAAYIDVDTTSVAYKAWVILQFGTAVNSLQQVIDNNNLLNRDDTINQQTNSLRILGTGSAANFSSKITGSNNEISQIDNVIGLVVFMKTQGYDGTRYGVVAIDSSNVAFGQTEGSYQYQFMNQANDTTTYKPVGMDNLGFIKRMDGWAGSGGGGGGSGDGIGRDTVQTYTSGTTLTQSASTNYIQVDPASVQAALTITTLASGGTWHTSNDLYIVFGGTVTSGAAVITSFTLTAGAGLTIVESAAFTGTANAGDVAHYHKIGTILYRVP